MQNKLFGGDLFMKGKKTTFLYLSEPDMIKAGVLGLMATMCSSNR